MFCELSGKHPEKMKIATAVINAMGICVVDGDDLHLRDDINARIAALEKIKAAQRLQDEKLRMCHAFDC